jgi:hypothetical protein
MFVDLLFESTEETEPYMGVAAKQFLNLLSRYIWVRAGSPLIDNFGLRFFNELCDLPFQMSLVKKFLHTILSSVYTDI